MGVQVIAVIVLGLSLSGCYFNSTLSSLNPALPIPTTQASKLVSVESVSGSTGYIITPVSGYKVKQSVGLLLNKKVAVTPNGYKIYLHASGRITSEELSR